jgi:hypothetical protein
LNGRFRAVEIRKMAELHVLYPEAQEGILVGYDTVPCARQAEAAAGYAAG